MGDWTKVRVSIDENGELAAVEVEGQIDKGNLTEERREAPALTDEPGSGLQAFWPLG